MGHFWHRLRTTFVLLPAAHPRSRSPSRRCTRAGAVRTARIVASASPAAWAATSATGPPLAITGRTAPRSHLVAAVRVAGRPHDQGLTGRCRGSLGGKQPRRPGALRSPSASGGACWAKWAGTRCSQVRGDPLCRAAAWSPSGNRWSYLRTGGQPSCTRARSAAKRESGAPCPDYRQASNDCCG